MFMQRITVSIAEAKLNYVMYKFAVLCHSARYKIMKTKRSV